MPMPSLQAALALFAPHDGYKRDAIAWRLRAEAAGGLQRAIGSLTVDLDRDERLITVVEAPTLTELKAWSPDAFQHAQRARLNGMIQDARGLDHLLAVDVPRWEAAIRTRLTGAAIEPPPSPRLESTTRQEHAVSRTLEHEC